MNVLAVMVSCAVAAGVPAAAFAQVPTQFRGTWAVDSERTAIAIEGDESMPSENKPGWTARWLDSGAELRITQSSIAVHGLEGGPIDLSVAVEEDHEDHTLLSAVFPAPPGETGMSLFVELRLVEGDRLNLRIREENDFDLVIWRRYTCGEEECP